MLMFQHPEGGKWSLVIRGGSFSEQLDLRELQLGKGEARFALTTG